MPIYIHVGDSSGENRQGGDGLDIIDLGSGADTAGGGGGFNIILGGSNADFLRSEGVWEDILGGSGDDTIVATGYGGWLFGGSGADTITGSDNDWLSPEHIFGGSGDDTIDGGGGGDFIIGGAGDDDLTGGAGADTFFFWEGHGTDTVQDFNLAEGDRIHLTNFDKTITWAQLQSKITLVTDPNDPNTVTGVQIDLSDWGGGTIVLVGITSIEDVTEDMFVLDQIVGSDDTDDTLEGGTDDDTMTGGTGADTFVFDEDSGNDTITDFSTAQGDKIDLSGFDAAITWEQLSSKITTVTDEHGTATGVRIDLGDWGGGTITLEGVASADLTADMFVLHALTGSDDSDDVLMGGTSDDTLTGGTGADTFVFVETSGNDTITDFSQAEGDKIDLCGFDAAITWNMLSTKITTVTDPNDPNTVTGVRIDLGEWGGGTIVLQGITSVSDVTEDMFILPGGSTIWRFGAEGANTIAAGGGDNIIYGMEGDDTLRGEGGDDMIFGGEGDDTLDGGVGDDVLMGGEGDDTLDGGEGDDMLIGGEGDDELTGGGGADTFVFGEDSGDDTITDFDTTQDKIHLKSLSQTITWTQLQSKITLVTDENNVVTGVQIDLSDWGGGTITLTGITSVSDLTEEMFVLDQIVGSDDSDDTLQGGTSDDTMTGGTGADTFVFDETSGDDTITDFDTAQDQIDLTAITASLTWQQLQAAMSAVEDDPNSLETESGTVIDLTGFGGGTITLEGVASADLTADMFVLDDFAGGDGADTIEGGTTDDTLTGGGGADTFVFDQDSGHDTVTDFSQAEGDQIDLSAFTDITSPGDLRGYQAGDAAVIFLGFNGGGSITLEGVQISDLSASDFIFYQSEYTGTAEADTLTGGAGDDTIAGLGGDDTLTGGDGADKFVFASGHGDDTITDFTDSEDTIDLSAFTSITGFDDLTVTQDGNNTVITVPGGGTITLQDFTQSDLDANDFVFHEEQQDGM
ncbi:MAG: calcium-binding protein [Rhodospirillales bacterium]|nr:calcium-binding protein [Rhodospirillales bacterium]